MKILLVCVILISPAFWSVDSKFVSAEEIDSLESLVSMVSTQRIDRYSLFTGLQIQTKTTNKVEDKPEKLLFESTLNRISTHLWRVDVVESDKRCRVYVCNGSYSFEATQDPDASDYRYGVSGYGAQYLREIEPSTLFRIQLLESSTQVYNVDLLEFLRLPSLSARDFESVETKDGRTAIKFDWDLVASSVYPEECYGSLVLLSENGFLVKSLDFNWGVRNKAAKSLNGVKFSVDYRKSGSTVIPVRAVKRDPVMTTICSLTQEATANDNPEFYTAESIGLVTPRNPFWIRVVWLVLGLLFFSFGVKFFFSRSNA